MVISEEYKQQILKHYKKTMLRTNMIKTSTSSTLIAAGLIIIQYGIGRISENPWTIVLGISILIGGFVVNYLGDLHKIERKREEIDIIDEAIRESTRRVLENLREDITNSYREDIEEKIYQSLKKRRQKNNK